MRKPAKSFRDRIKGFRRVAAGSLVDNPGNWRTHPQGQRNALSAVLEEVGFAGAVLESSGEKFKEIEEKEITETAKVKASVKPTT